VLVKAKLMKGEARFPGQIRKWVAHMVSAQWWEEDDLRIRGESVWRTYRAPLASFAFQSMNPLSCCYTSRASGFG
jgi:hypothetical protein